MGQGGSHTADFINAIAALRSEAAPEPGEHDEVRTALCSRYARNDIWIERGTAMIVATDIRHNCR